jgi:hypothetical protein
MNKSKSLGWKCRAIAILLVTIVTSLLFQTNGWAMAMAPAVPIMTTNSMGMVRTNFGVQPMQLTDWTKSITPTLTSTPKAVECQAQFAPWVWRGVIVCICTGGAWACHKIKQWCDRYLGHGTNAPTAGPLTNTNNIAFSGPIRSGSFGAFNDNITPLAATASDINGTTLNYQSIADGNSIVGNTPDGTPVIIQFAMNMNPDGSANLDYPRELQEDIRMSTNFVNWDVLRVKIFIGAGTNGIVRAELWTTGANAELKLAMNIPYPTDPTDPNYLSDIQVNFGTNNITQYLWPATKPSQMGVQIRPETNNMLPAIGY